MDSQSSSTSTLIRDLGAGQSMALRGLYLKVAPGLLVWANLRVPEELRHYLEPEDLIQETWMRAVRRIGSFDPARGTFRTWLFSIANHVLVSELRKMRVRGRRRLPPPVDDQLLAGFADTVTSVTEQLARRDEVHKLLAYARSLDADTYRLLLFRGLEGLPYKEVGERLGVAPETCEARWRRLLQRLRERFPPADWFVE